MSFPTTIAPAELNGIKYLIRVYTTDSFNELDDEFNCDEFAESLRIGTNFLRILNRNLGLDLPHIETTNAHVWSESNRQNSSNSRFTPNSDTFSTRSTAANTQQIRVTSTTDNWGTNRPTYPSRAVPPILNRVGGNAVGRSSDAEKEKSELLQKERELKELKTELRKQQREEQKRLKEDERRRKSEEREREKARKAEEKRLENQRKIEEREREKQRKQQERQRLQEQKQRERNRQIQERVNREEAELQREYEELERLIHERQTRRSTQNSFVHNSTTRTGRTTEPTRDEAPWGQPRCNWGADGVDPWADEEDNDFFTDRENDEDEEEEDETDAPYLPDDSEYEEEEEDFNDEDINADRQDLLNEEQEEEPINDENFVEDVQITGVHWYSGESEDDPYRDDEEVIEVIQNDSSESSTFSSETNYDRYFSDYRRETIANRQEELRSYGRIDGRNTTYWASSAQYRGRACPLCLDEYDRNTNITSFNCGHTICTDCYQNSEIYECPICHYHNNN